MALKRVNERSRLPLTISFADGDWVAATPTSIRYKIDCLTSNTAIVGWTVVPPSSSFSFTVTSSQNAIVSDANPTETKELTVEANYDTDDQYTDVYDWLVVNQSGIT